MILIWWFNFFDFYNELKVLYKNLLFSLFSNKNDVWRSKFEEKNEDFVEMALLISFL